MPGLYKHEELGPLLDPLREQMEDVGGFKTTYEFFVHRIRTNLHVAIAMDPTNPTFEIRCESNPALYTRCAILWMGQWSRASLTALPVLLLPNMFDLNSDTCLDDDSQALLQAAVQLHTSQCSGPKADGGSDKQASPRDYISFLTTFESLYSDKRGGEIVSLF